MDPFRSPITWICTLSRWVAAAFLVLLLPFAAVICRAIRRGSQLIQGPVCVRDRVVLITGASSGIGRCLALEYAKRGAKLVLCARHEARLREVANECKECGVEEVAICAANITHEEDCKRMINFTISTYGHLDVLVHNARTGINKLFEDYDDPSKFRYSVDADLWGNILTTNYTIEHLRRSTGQIVVTCSVGACIPYPYLSLHNAAKGALLNFYDTLRTEPISRHVTITVAFPGFAEAITTENEAPKYIPKRWSIMPMELAAIAIVEGAIERRRYVVVPGWYTSLLLYRVFAPEILIWVFRMFLLGKPPNRFVDIVMNTLVGQKSASKSFGALTNVIHNI